MLFRRLEEVREVRFGVVQLSVRVGFFFLSRDCFLIIAESPGSTVGATTIENSLYFIAECINRAHKATKTVKLVLENMVRPGHRSFEICTIVVLDTGRSRKCHWLTVFSFSWDHRQS